MTLSNKVKIKKISKFKIIIFLLFAPIVLFIGFKLVSNKESTSIKYTFGAVEKGNITNFLSNTGQVYTSEEYNVISKVSSNVINILKKKGDIVKKGDIIIQLDSSDLTKQIRSAQLTLDNAKNNYAKAIEPLDELEKIQAETSLQNAKDSLEKLKSNQVMALAQAEKNKIDAEISLKNVYSTILNTIDTVFIGLSTIENNMGKILYLTDNLIPQDVINSEKNITIDMNNFWDVEVPSYWNDIINSSNFDSSSDKEVFINLVKRATVNYKNSKALYDKNVITYRTLTKNSSNEEIESFLDVAIKTMISASDALRDLNSVYNFWIDYNTQRHRTYYYSINTYNNTLKSDTNSVSSYLTSLNNAKTGNSGVIALKYNLSNYSNTLENLKKTQPMDLLSAENSLKIQEASYKKSREGITDLEKRSYLLTISDAQCNLDELQKTIENYIIKAPFDGVVAKVSISEGDVVSNGTSMMTIISNQSIAQLTFNEVDIAKIKIDQKAMLTFDAIDDLTISGSVIDVDTLGSTNSGVVSYTVKIAFDVEDSRIKPGMSATANIILEKKNNVLIVSNSAIKTNGDDNYVEIFENNSKAIAGNTLETDVVPAKKNIEIGLSDDTNTEIISGLNENDVVIVKTTKTTTTTKSNGSSLIQTNRNSSSSSFKSSNFNTSSTKNNNIMMPPGF